MNFQEAENQFRWLESQLATGQMSLDQYRAALNQIRVMDAQGRLWMPQERTGAWHVFDGQRWVAAAPYPPAAPGAPPVAMPYQPAAPAVPPTTMPVQPRAGGGSKIVLYLIIWFVVSSLVGVAVYFVGVGKQQPMALLVVAGVSLLSLVMMLLSAFSHWRGQVVDIREERVRVQHGSHSHYERRTVAHIRQPDGRTRKVRAARDWRIGDWLEKRSGDMRIYKL